MLVDYLSIWAHEANLLILALFKYIFPEYPKIGIAVFITAAIFFVYYLARGKFQAAIKMTLSTLVFFIVLLYSAHWLIKVFRVVI